MCLSLLSHRRQFDQMAARKYDVFTAVILIALFLTLCTSVSSRADESVSIDVDLSDQLENEGINELSSETKIDRDLQSTGSNSNNGMRQLFRCPRFRATNTDSARVNYVTCGITACGGSTFMANSCASYSGNTFTTLATNTGLTLMSNEDSPLCGPDQGSAVITYTVPGPSQTCSVFVLRQGCFENTTCSGQMTVSGTSGVSAIPARLNSPTMNPATSLSPTPATPIFSCPSFSASNTSSGTDNVISCGIRACGGQSFTASMCPNFGGMYTGNTYLTLVNGSTPGGTVLQENDDYCIIGSQLTYTVPGPSSSCSMFTLNQGCVGDTSCTGTTVIVGSPGIQYNFVPSPTPACPSGSTWSVMFGRCLCSAGTALVNGVCQQCPAGQFGPVPGLKACESCGPNGFSTTRGATSCEACPAGAITNRGRPPCACAPGFSSSGSGSNLVCTRIPGSTPAPSPARLRQLFSCAPFSTNNTNSAQTNWVGCGIQACGGSTFVADTCLGYVGNTYIRLFDAHGIALQNSVDSPSCGYGKGSAYITYTVPGSPSECQTFILRQGCFGNTGCSGVTVISGNRGVSSSAVPVLAPTPLPRGSTFAPSSQSPLFTCPPYMANNTNSAAANFATCGIRACGGQTFTASSCVAFGGDYFGNTFMSLVNSAGVVVLSNNDFCFVGSQITYTPPGPSTNCSVFTLRLGCAGNTQCGGTVAIVGNPNVQYYTVPTPTPPCPENSFWNRLFGRCLCQPGFVMSSALKQCVVCPAGYFAGINGTRVCNTCPINTFNNVAGASRCMPCPANSIANFRAATQCECSPGFINTARPGSAVINCQPGTLSAPPSSAQISVPTPMPNSGITPPPRTSAPTPTSQFVAAPTVSVPFNYVEVTTFSGTRCAGEPMNGMVSGTNQQICGRIAGGNEQVTTCDTSFNPNVISIATFGAGSTCSTSSTSSASTYSFNAGCLQTGPSTSTQQRCISTTTPFAQYGAGLLFTWSNQNETCNQRSPIVANKWTFTPINRCISNVPGQAPYVITRCSSTDNTYTISQYGTNDFLCSRNPVGPPNVQSLRQCVREPSGLFLGVVCVNN